MHSSVKFDAARAKAGLPGFSGSWDTGNARALYWSASLLDTRYADVAQKLAPEPPRWLWAYALPCRR